MMTRLTSAVVFVVAASLLALSCGALEVFINTNSPAKSSQGSQLFERDQWRRAAEAVDGIWYVGQGMTKPPEGKSIAKARDQFIESLKDKQWIVEMKAKSAAGMSEGKHTVHEVKAMKDGGVKAFSAMVWDEKENKDSTVSAASAADVRAGLTGAGVPQTRLIVNTRAFRRNHLLQTLVREDKVDGFSIEVPSGPVRQGKIIEAELATAIEFAVKNKKDVYVLLNAERSTHLLEDVQDIFHRLNRVVGREMHSKHVRIVVSAYSAGKTQFTPERQGNEYGNTVTGAALWLCHEADKRGLRKGQGN